MIDTVPEVRTKISNLLQALCKGLYEREEPVHLAFLAAIAGESIFLLGPPGVGKSLIARRLKYAFLDGVSFEYLMSKFSTPDEVFGPVSIKKLKEEDKYERLTERYLPGANIVFLDEIWKAGPAIQNALLTILNEKIYRNGEEDLKVNIRGIITASNELPPQNANLAPIWDRFLVRLEMGNIKKFNNFLNMITDVKDVYQDDISSDFKLDEKTLDKWSSEIDQVELGAEILNTIQLVKVKIIEHNARPNNVHAPIIVHDRRWKKIVRLLRTSAFLNGRKKVDLMDCFLMEHCLWSNPDQKIIIKEIITESIAKHGYTMAVNLNMLKKEVKEFEEDVDAEIHINHTVSEEELLPVDDDYFEIKKKDNRFNGALVSIKQYRQLTIEDKLVINFYDKDKNLINRIRSSKGKQNHTIVIHHDSQENVYSLNTRLVDKKEVILKKPHEVIQKYWDDRYQKLMQFIEKQLYNIAENKPKEITDLYQNFFVEAELADVVTRNFDEVETSLKNLKLQLEKLQFSYTKI